MQTKQMSHEEYIKKHILVFDNAGKLKCRERVDLEYKESYNFNSASKYAKTMASFANNVGGYIIFGVKDKPREIVGVNKAFYTLPIERMTDVLNSYFSPEIQWEEGVVEIGDKSIGYFYIEESNDKPVVAIKSGDEVSDGDVYYRYKARSEKIKYPEMMRIINEREQKIQTTILKLIEAVKNGNTPNIGIVNYSNGRISTPYGVDLTVDRKLILQALKHAKYIKQGTFSEGGEPVLKITGQINLAEEIPVPNVEPDVQYPYIQKQMAEELKIKTQQLYALIWKFGLKEQRKLHIEITTTKNGKIHKFSRQALQYLSEIINEHKDDEEWLNQITLQFNHRDKGV